MLNRKIPKTPKRRKKRSSQREEPIKKRELIITEQIYVYYRLLACRGVCLRLCGVAPRWTDRLTACRTVALVQMVVDRLWVAADQVRVLAQVPDCYPAEEESDPDPDRVGRMEQLAVALVFLFRLNSSSVLLRWLN